MKEKQNKTWYVLFCILSVLLILIEPYLLKIQQIMMAKTFNIMWSSIGVCYSILLGISIALSINFAKLVEYNIKRNIELLRVVCLLIMALFFINMSIPSILLLCECIFTTNLIFYLSHKS